MPRRFGGVLLIAIALLASTGCRKSKPITVGSKNSTEQMVLGEIVAQQLENKLHQEVVRRLGLGGTTMVHESLMSGEIDVYPEYSGVAQAAILRLSVVPDPQVVFDRVREVYRTNLQMDWLNPLGFQTPGVMVVRKDDAEKYSLDVLSDAEKRRDGWALGTTDEFSQRPDGMSALNRTYRFAVVTSPAVMDQAHLYSSLGQKRVTMIPGNLTDGFLDAALFKALRDDRNAFPPYQPSIVVSLAAEARMPGLKAALDELSGKISREKMQEMNRAVDVLKRPVAQVAATFLSETGLK